MGDCNDLIGMKHQPVSICFIGLRGGQIVDPPLTKYAVARFAPFRVRLRRAWSSTPMGSAPDPGLQEETVIELVTASLSNRQTAAETVRGASASVTTVGE